MVERVLSMHEAQGSIPCSSTFFVFFFFASQLLVFVVSGGSFDKTPGNKTKGSTTEPSCIGKCTTQSAQKFC
jgi:hypothetical protein